MNLRFYIICIAALLAFATPALADGTATVHGTVYTWDTFEPLENAVVEVNSTPSQSMVANLSFYSFKLEPGTYNITARYYEDGTLLYSAQKTMEIEDAGDYRLDLLLFPVYSSDLMDDSQENEATENPAANTQASLTGENNSNAIEAEEDDEAGTPVVSYIVAAFALFTLFGGGYSLSTKRKRTEEKKQTSPKAKAEEYSRPEYKPETPAQSVISFEPDKGEKPYASISEINNKSEAGTEPDVKTDLQKDSEGTGYRNSNEIGLRVEPRIESDYEEPVLKPELIISEKSLSPEIKQAKESEIKPEFKIQEHEKKTIEKEARNETPGVQLPSLTKPIESETEEMLNSGKDEEIEYKIKEAESGDSGLDERVYTGSLDDTLNKPELSSSEMEPASPRKKAPLPVDLQEIMDIIRGQGGRITQKNLRSKLKYSEGKVSLMLADLERRELIEKFKRGRGNIVIIKDEER